jgi:hypothetical protein
MRRSIRAKIATDFEPLAERVLRFCRTTAPLLDTFDFEEKREVLEALQVRVTVDLEKVVSVFCVIPADDADDRARYVTARHASA